MSQLALLGGEPLRRKPFSAWPQYLESDKARLISVLESRKWGGFPFPNKYAAEFAEKFAAYHGAKYGVPLANGTIALVVALQAAGIRFGDEVIVPAYTWDGTATAVLFAGGVPVFADIDPETYCMDPASVRQLITPRTKALLPVHLAMRFADMDALLAIAKEHKLAVIEDCAHVHGGQYKGQGAGSMGDIGCFSMQESKLMTSGEGGIVITSKLEYEELIETYVNCGRASATDEFGRRVVGSNYRITELQTALLIGQLEMLPGFAEKRSKHAAILSERLSRMEGVRPLPPQSGITREAIYCYVFQYDEKKTGVPRDLFVAALDKEGVPADGRFYEPVYRSDLFRPTAEEYPQLKDVDYGKVKLPVSERAAYNEAVWLPQFVLIGDEQDARDVADAVEKVLANREALSKADPKLAGVKGMSRAERPRIEKKNY